MLTFGVCGFHHDARTIIRYAAVLLALVVLLSSYASRKKKYDNPITKDTQQPDKVLFDLAIQDIEHSRFEKARLLLQTMMNTYDNSEYLAKAKLAVADSWYREGGAHGFAQAEAEYKDFILFYPTMEEAAEAQEKICKMQYQQMEKADRDPMHALRAEDECRQLLVQFPNSKFAPEAQQMLRNVAGSAGRRGIQGRHVLPPQRQHARGRQPPGRGCPTSSRSISQADEALWELADSYRRMGDRFEDQQADAYARIVKDYPLSIHADAAKAAARTDEAARAGSRSRGHGAHEIRPGESRQTQPPGQGLGTLRLAARHHLGGQIRQPADDRLPSHRSKQRAAGRRRHTRCDRRHRHATQRKRPR